MSDRYPTETQVSAGGVVYRRQGDQVEIALISVGPGPRWQLPKGMVKDGEEQEDAARREVREEAGLETEIVAPLDRVEYWFYATSRGRRVRIHKFVHFYLMRYRDGDVSNHDHEVNEARWIEIERAQAMLAFDSDRKLVARAQELIAELD
jgi:8-oxo-dGTP pyrophosphatase MutT (NUDIX family)